MVDPIPPPPKPTVGEKFKADWQGFDNWETKQTGWIASNPKKVFLGVVAIVLVLAFLFVKACIHS